MLESVLESKVVKHCHTHGLLAYKFSSPSRRGVPDRCIVGRGKVLFLELKAKGNRPTALQDREIALLNAKGIMATWCDSYDRAVEIIDDHFLGESVG